MTVYVTEALREFYQEVWQLAMSGGSNHWCQIAGQHPGANGALTLIPRNHLHAALIRHWPTLPEGDPNGEAGWIPTTDKIQDAFTAVLRSNGPRVDVGSDQARRRLHLAEQHVAAGELTPDLADLVLQVAIFGQVRF